MRRMVIRKADLRVTKLISRLQASKRLIALATLALGSRAVGSAEPEELDHYVFDGIELEAKFDFGYYPIERVTRWWVVADTPYGTRKFGYSSPALGYSDTEAVSPVLVEIMDLDVKFSRRLVSSGSSGLSTGKHERAAAAIGGSSTPSVGSSLSVPSRWHLRLRLTVTSPVDLLDAHCVVLPRGPSPEPIQERMTNGVLRIFRLGELLANVPRRFTFRTRLPYGPWPEEDLDVFLFNGDGKPLATNRSHGLRPVKESE